MYERLSYFGTDGIRGLVGDPPITPDCMLKLGWAIGKAMRLESYGNKVLVGKDTRISGVMLESALEAGLSCAGINIGELGFMPTPGVAWLTKSIHAGAGIVISASHNQYHDNGVKIFDENGNKLSKKLESNIERYLKKKIVMVSNESLGTVTPIVNAEDKYVDFCKQQFNKKLNLKNLKIVIDCANGANYKIAPRIFTELGASLELLGVEPNGLNINVNCGSTALSALIKKVKISKADLGIAFDGDGDRLIIIDNKGNIIDGDQILFILAKLYLSSSIKSPGIVGTIMSNLGLEQAINALGLKFIRTKVGDRHILEQLIKRNWWLGGETSGHIICRNLNTTGDGIIAALKVLEAMLLNQKSLHELLQSMIKYPQNLINIPFKKSNKYEELIKNVNFKKIYRELANQLHGQGRIVIRRSGTEPLVRLMVEGQNKKMVNLISKSLEQAISSVIQR